jgi:hypothetical protein
MSPEERQKAVLQRQLHGLPNDDGRRPKIAAYATKLDKTILCISSVCAIVAGTLNPLVPVRLSRFISTQSTPLAHPCLLVGHIWPPRRCLQRFHHRIRRCCRVSVKNLDVQSVLRLPQRWSLRLYLPGHSRILLQRGTNR